MSMMCRPKWPFLHMYGSHDMRHVDFRGLTGSQRTPRVWDVTPTTFFHHLQLLFTYLTKVMTLSMSRSFFCSVCDNSLVIPNIALIKCKLKIKLNDCIDSNKLDASYLYSEFEPSSIIISSTLNDCITSTLKNGFLVQPLSTRKLTITKRLNYYRNLLITKDITTFR